MRENLLLWDPLKTNEAAQLVVIVGGGGGAGAVAGAPAAILEVDAVVAAVIRLSIHIRTRAVPISRERHQRLPASGMIAQLKSRQKLFKETTNPVTALGVVENRQMNLMVCPQTTRGGSAIYQ